MKQVLFTIAAAFAGRCFHAAPDDKAGGPLPLPDAQPGEPPLARERTPLGPLMTDDETKRRRKHAERAAEYLAAEEAKRVEQAARDGRKYEPQRTPTADEILAELPAGEKAKPLQLPTQGEGTVINGYYVPTLAEVTAAGYAEPEKTLAGILEEARGAGCRRGIVAPIERVPELEQPEGETTPPPPPPAAAEPPAQTPETSTPPNPTTANGEQPAA